MRKIYLHIILSSVIIVLANNVSYSQNGIITGKVKHGTEALQSATVSLGNQTTYTDHKGEFSFSVKPGKYTITATHVSYKKNRASCDSGSRQYKKYRFRHDNQ